MAETSAPEFVFVDVPEKDKTNEYDAVVKALAEAGEGKAYPLTTKTDVHETARRKFGEAAHRIGKTARLVTQEVKGDETTTVTVLRPRVTRNASESAPAEDGEE